ncbi:MAG: hypothetical protein M1833_001857 [Piccolia ochrophora]|nr:MAG: hypothetical protein M1833_001857 [Piccolia ochrophora]
MYVRFLGPDGHRMLTEEVKWLAMTHKSFDHGRRGFNDRLAYLGHRILRLQTTLALLDTPPTPTPEDPYDRTPVTDPALRGLENLSDDVVAAVLDKKRVAGVASRSGIGEVLRWTPHKPYDLHASGISNVLAEALFAVVGAVSLQKGGEVAAKVARERILNYLIPKERRRV